MAMPAHPTEWTVEMVRAIPEDSNRYEVIDGELFVTPAPSVAHQRAVLELALLVAPYVRAHRIGEALIAPADVIVYGPRKFVQPDLFVVPGRSPPAHRRGALALDRAHGSRSQANALQGKGGPRILDCRYR